MEPRSTQAQGAAETALVARAGRQLRRVGVPLYWRGARLDGNYPMSIALEGQAVNITVTNNADNLDFGLVGCRRSVPHLQRLLGHLETSLKDLERAFGL